MVSGIFHSGSGLGNQLHRYVATRVLAKDKGYDFSMVAPSHFKGKSFMNLDMGKEPSFIFHTEEPAGKVVVDNWLDYEVSGFGLWEEETNYYNPEFNFIEDNTIIDGEFQDERYFCHRMDDIDEWLKVEPIYVPDDVCVIGFRGGEFYSVPELGLPVTYFAQGINMMREMNPNIRFEVHTDDPFLAKWVLGDILGEVSITHDIGINWRSMRYAKYAIVANSSFYILPRLLAHNESEMTDEDCITIAPRYWDRYNIKQWERPYNYYKAFKYI